jgi:hypothetical protein
MLWRGNRSVAPVFVSIESGLSSSSPCRRVLGRVPPRAAAENSGVLSAGGDPAAEAKA